MQIIHETAKSLTVTTPLYDLGGGPIRSFVLKQKDSSLIVVSPPMRFSEDEFREIGKFGEVKSLVASNKFHFMGIPSWKRRFPNAKVYASRTALPRLKKKIGPSIDETNQLALDPDTHFLSCPGTKNGELLVVSKDENSLTWYMTDLFFNFVELPKKIFNRLMVQKVCGTGVVVNPFCRFLFVKDRTEVREWLLEQLVVFPPTSIVFSHGDPIQDPESLERFRAGVRSY